MAMTESQFYGGSAQEARDGWESFQLREQAIEYGYTVRREKGKIIIVPNASPNKRMKLTQKARRSAQPLDGFRFVAGGKACYRNACSREAAPEAGRLTNHCS